MAWVWLVQRTPAAYVNTTKSCNGRYKDGKKREHLRTTRLSQHKGTMNRNVVTRKITIVSKTVRKIWYDLMNLVKSANTSISWNFECLSCGTEDI